MLDSLILPFTFPFMQHAFLIVLLVAVPTSLLSCILVLKGWSLMGDAISHSILPGIVIAYVLSLPYTLGAFSAGMFCALSTGYLKENSRVKEDTILGVVFSSMFALGIVLMTKIEVGVHLDHILFGDALGVSDAELFEALIVACLVVGCFLLRGKDMLVYVFDHQHAQAIGLPVKLLHYGLLALLSLSIVSALKAVGMILVVSMLIAPGATAFLLTKNFYKMTIVAIILSCCASLCGMYMSFFIDSAPAPTIILVFTVVFIIAFCCNAYQNRKICSAMLSHE